MTIPVWKEDFRYDTLRARHFPGSRTETHLTSMSEANTSPAPRPITYAGRFTAARQELMAASERGEGGRNALRQYSHRMDALVQQLFADAGCYLAVVPTYVGGFMALGWGSDDPASRAVPLAVLEARFAASGLKTRYYTPAVHQAAFALPAFIEEIVEGAKRAVRGNLRC